jgi:hypothetical protein
VKAVLTKVDTDERYVFHDGLRPMNTPCKHRLRKVQGDHLIAQSTQVRAQRAST